MEKILIVDNDKTSLLYTSESIKFCLNQPQIIHVTNGLDCLNVHKSEKLDLIIVDFDLPDCDGVSLSKELKKEFKGPIFITSYHNEIIEKAINIELFPYKDSQQWLPKPLKLKAIKENIDTFIIKKTKPIKIFKSQHIIKSYSVGKILKNIENASILKISIESVIIKAKNLLHLNKGDYLHITIEKEKKQITHHLITILYIVK
jgi:Response regulator containing CheY-like receiver, AAA-type ATPase, and DNA-binding domains